MTEREDDGGPAPLDEDAAWAALVAGYDKEPAPGVTPAWPDAENVTDEPRPGRAAEAGAAPPASPTGGIVMHPVIRGPRDYGVLDADDDEHYVPPEPPPLPEADTTTKFAWLAVLGGPLLLLGFILLQLELTWWAILLGVGGFLGGFATLVARMRTGEDDDDMPDGGAVV